MKVTVPCKTIRSMAREMMKGRYIECVLVLLACKVASSAPSYLATTFTESEFFLELADFIGSLLTIALNLGVYKYYLGVFRGEPVNVETITDAFALIIPAFIMSIISEIEITLLTFLLIIPGLLCAISHVLIFPVMADNPELRPMQCISASQSLMAQNKWKYVKLMLSFLGWMILASVPLAIYNGIHPMDFSAFVFDIPSSVAELQLMTQSIMDLADQFVSNPVNIILRGFSIFVDAYMMMTTICFYDIASGKLVFQGNEETVQYVDM